MDSLEVGRGVFEAVRGGVEKGLLGGGRGVGGGAALTFAAAAGEVAKRDEERKAWEEARREARSKGRSVKGGAPARGVNKGAVIGGKREDLSQWWLVMQDYFRPVSVEDVLAVLPTSESLDPLSDPAFRVPRVGRDVDMLDEAEFWGPPGANKGSVSEQVDSRRQSNAIAEDPRGTAQRRSHRLASKHGTRDGSFPSTFDSAFCEEILDADQMSPWLCLPHSEGSDPAHSTTYLLGLCGDDDLTALASHIEMSAGTAAPECNVLKGADEDGEVMGKQGNGVEERRERLLSLLEKAVEDSPQDAKPFMDEVDPSGREDKVDSDILEALLGGTIGCATLGPKGDSPIISVEPDHALSQSDESPRAQDFRDSNDPMHPFTKMVLQHTLPPHVFACPTASQPNASESNKLLESTKPGASGSPATPMLEAQVHVHDPCTLETSPTGGVKPVNNGFQFPTPPGQDCTPILNTRHQLEYDAACNRNGHSNGNGMLPCGDTGPDGGCESRGMSTVKRKRPDVDYSLLAGRTVMPSTNNTAGKRKPPKSATGSQAEVNTNPTLLAVQNAVAAGPAEGDINDQWTQLEAAKDQCLLEYAPDDEIMAEIIACQAELMQQSAANRARLKITMEGVLRQLPAMRKEVQQKEQMEQEIAEHLKAIADYRREKQREKRDASKKRNSVATTPTNATPTLTPRNPRPSRPFYPEAVTPSTTQPPKRERSTVQTHLSTELLDPLAQRGSGDEALCGVCGEGHSEEPNVIVFCERCDLAVHQECYGVGEVPAGEWLCAPCAVAEDKLRKEGVGNDAIVAGRRTGEDGSRAVDCALCPVKWGAFKMTTDKRKWVHVACCHAHRETSLLPGNICEAVEGVQDIPNSRRTIPCDLCQRQEGAVLRCSYGNGNCSKNFHFLCARREGLATMKASQKLGQTSQFVCSVQCRNHHAAQRKDAITPARAVELAARQKDKGNQGIMESDLQGPSLPQRGYGQHGIDAHPLNVDPAIVDKDTGLEQPVEARANPPVPMSASDRQRAIESLESKKRDLATLNELRLDLESVRMLSAECKRRERLKTQIANTKIQRKNTIISDIPKYLPYVEVLCPLQQSAPVPPATGQEPMQSTTATASTSEPLAPAVATKRGRPVGPRSTRGALKRTESGSNNGALVNKKSGRKNVKGNQSRTKKEPEVKQFSDALPSIQLETDTMLQTKQIQARRRNTRAMTRCTRSAMTHSSVQGSQRLDPEPGLVQNDQGRSNNIYGEAVAEAHGRLSVNKRTRGKYGPGDEPKQGLAPERALTGEEVREINSEIRSCGFVYVRNDEMDVDEDDDDLGHA